MLHVDMSSTPEEPAVSLQLLEEQEMAVILQDSRPRPALACNHFVARPVAGRTCALVLRRQAICLLTGAHYQMITNCSSFCMVLQGQKLPAQCHTCCTCMRTKLHHDKGDLAAHFAKGIIFETPQHAGVMSLRYLHCQQAQRHLHCSLLIVHPVTCMGSGANYAINC